MTLCFFAYSSLAQSVERVTVNHDAVGSSPTGGAKLDKGEPLKTFAFVCFLPRTSCVRISCSSLRNNIYYRAFPITFVWPECYCKRTWQEYYGRAWKKGSWSSNKSAPMGAEKRRDTSQRPGFPVHLEGIHRLLLCSQYNAEHEPCRVPLWQRSYGALLQHVEKRTYLSAFI